MYKLDKKKINYIAFVYVGQYFLALYQYMYIYIFFFLT